MNSIRRAALVCLALILVPLPAPAGEQCTVKFFTGKVLLGRQGKTIPMGVGDPVTDGDVFRLPERSVLRVEMKSTGASLEISGPRIFRFEQKHFSLLPERGALAARLLGKISRNTRTYYPRTVVTAVRKGEEDGKRAALDADGVRAMKELAESYGQGDMERARRALGKLDEILLHGLRRETVLLMGFYRAGILFEEMRFDEALREYLLVYRARASQFPHGEEAHSRACLCAHLIGDNALAERLLEEYLSAYGKKGKYAGEMLALSGEKGK